MLNRNLNRYANCLFLLLLICLTSASYVSAQRSLIIDPDWQRERLLEENERRLRSLNSGSADVPALYNSSRMGRSFKVSSKEILGQLVVNQQDYNKYESFLKAPDTGIFKLLSNKNCFPIKKDKEYRECFKRQIGILLNKASSYSFSERKYVGKTEADIALFNNQLSAAESDIQTIIVNLGDVSLENLTLESDGITFLKDFKPKTSIEDVRKQFTLFSKGLLFRNYIYSKSAKLDVNNVYAVRAITYDGNTYIKDKKSADLIIVMKLIQYEMDSSATFIWKKISEKEAPKLNYDIIPETTITF